MITALKHRIGRAGIWELWSRGRGKLQTAGNEEEEDDEDDEEDDDFYDKFQANANI